jgi:hypothetical protein
MLNATVIPGDAIANVIVFEKGQRSALYTLEIGRESGMVSLEYYNDDPADFFRPQYLPVTEMCGLMPENVQEAILSALI